MSLRHLKRTIMGMDVHGKNPTSEVGSYFRNNMWHWRALATYVCGIDRRLTDKCEHWQSNDGAGLNAKDSAALATRLQAEIDSGRTANYVRVWASQQEMMPDEPCWLCEGTGTRKPAPERGDGDLATGTICNGCDGKGYIRPYATMCPISVENVQRFTNFLRDCGGFEIW